MGGCVVRASQGDFVYGFAYKFLHQHVLQVELDAILKGLQICKDRQLFNIEVETDSELAYTLLTRNSEAEIHLYHPKDQAISCSLQRDPSHVSRG